MGYNKTNEREQGRQHQPEGAVAHNLNCGNPISHNVTASFAMLTLAQRAGDRRNPMKNPINVSAILVDVHDKLKRRIIRNDLAITKYDHSLRPSIGEIYIMGRNQKGSSFFSHFSKYFFQHRRILGIQSCRRLIKNDNIRIMYQ